MKNKLQYEEQYGYWAYYVDEERIYDLKEVEINGTKYKVLEANNTDIIYEMGHRDIVNSTKYHIKVPFEGIKVLVDLVQVMDKKLVIATKFSTKKPNICICDGCQHPIINEFDGLIIHGGIYTADPKKNGGLIGNCFEPDKNGMVEYNKIAETVLCMNCFKERTSRDRRPYGADTLRKVISHADREC